MVSPNAEQWKVAVRWLLNTGGGAVLGFAVAKGWLTPDQLQQVSSFLSSEVVISTIVSLGMLVWGIISHTQANTVAIVAAMDKTDVSLDGKTVHILDPALAKAAKESATLPVK